ncbi:MAG: trigger factor [Chloroflexota bacterium]|nr:trigger factor [Chloroflexota bacterium]
MKVDSTELPPRQVSLSIEVEQERVDRAMDEAYRRLAGRVDVPGFRRGRAPRPMVERIIGRDRIVEEALEQLVPAVVNEAMQQQKLEAYTRPRVESIELEPLRVKAVIGLPPRVELGDYKGALKVPAEQPSVAEEDVERVIERLRTSHAQWAPVEGPVKMGDRVGLDLRVTVEGRDKPVSESRDAEYVVDLEGVQPAPGFAEALVGMEPGSQRSFTLTLGDDYRDSDLAGQPARFEVSLHWVKQRELPEVDDEFARQVGEYADVGALRAAIEAQLREHEEQRVREKLQEAAVSRLVEISSIEVPPQLIEHQTQHMLETFQRNVEQQGLQLPQYLRLVGKDQQGLEQEIRAEAETRVRRSLALDAFADAEHIAVEQAEIEEEVRRAAAASSDAGAVERLALNNPTTLARVQEVTRERKALARLLEVATGNGQPKSREKSAERAATSDTQRHSRTAARSEDAGAESAEDRGTA